MDALDVVLVDEFVFTLMGGSVLELVQIFRSVLLEAFV